MVAWMKVGWGAAFSKLSSVCTAAPSRGVPRRWDPVPAAGVPLNVEACGEGGFEVLTTAVDGSRGRLDEGWLGCCVSTVSFVCLHGVLRRWDPFPAAGFPLNAEARGGRLVWWVRVIAWMLVGWCAAFLDGFIRMLGWCFLCPVGVGGLSALVGLVRLGRWWFCLDGVDVHGSLSRFFVLFLVF